MISPYIFAGLPNNVVNTINSKRVEHVVLFVCGRLGIDPDDFFSKSRLNHLVDARAIACKMLRNSGYSFSDMEEIIGKDRTTLYHYIDKFDAHYRMYQDFKQKADLCLK